MKNCDQQVLKQLDKIRSTFPDLYNPWKHPSALPYHQRLKDSLEESQALLITGGHVAVLRNRLIFFGLHKLIRDFLLAGKPVIAWSAGSMVLTEKIVLYYDNPPQGEGHPEVLDSGIGLMPKAIFFPNAHERLNLQNKERISQLARRFEPALCIGLENGAKLQFDGRQLYDLGPQESSFIMRSSGQLEPISPIDS